MSRLIDADELIRKIQEKEGEPDYQHEGESWSVGLIMAEEIADSAPTIDAEPIRHGKWVKNDNGTYSCSECQSWIPNEQHYYARYCLYCGAKMDEFAEENNMTITDEIAKNIIDEANKACAKCQEFDCWECEYRQWKVTE